MPGLYVIQIQIQAVWISPGHYMLGQIRKITNLELNTYLSEFFLVFVFIEIVEDVCYTESGPKPNSRCVFPFTFEDGKTHNR